MLPYILKYEKPVTWPGIFWTKIFVMFKIFKTDGALIMNSIPWEAKWFRRCMTNENLPMNHFTVLLANDRKLSLACLCLKILATISGSDTPMVLESWIQQGKFVAKINIYNYDNHLSDTDEFFMAIIMISMQNLIMYGATILALTRRR